MKEDIYIWEIIVNEEEVHDTILTIFLSNWSVFELKKLKGFCLQFLVLWQAGYAPKWNQYG